MTDIQAKRLWLETNTVDPRNDVLVASTWDGKFVLYAPHGCGVGIAAGFASGLVGRQAVLDAVDWRCLKIERAKEVRIVIDRPDYMQFLVVR